MSGLSLKTIARANLARCLRWHPAGIASWSVTDWSNAVLGELGEAANAIKKLRRVEEGMANISVPERQISDRETALRAIGEELADTFIYLDLLAQRLGLDLETEIINKFNATSEKYGFPERLALPLAHGKSPSEQGGASA